ncbi:MAG: FAD:protein FMN transferase [Bacteroidales bacterium]|nr:FAD:protein FMN transferase [Bacteroidales bacterium]MCL2132907.1 FAD:protein FMN transferase [Bacteroidales bacterium]
MKRFTVYLRLSILLFTVFSCNFSAQQYKIIDGFALGTTYHIIYRDVQERDFQPAIDSVLAVFCKSLSIYDSTSIIAKVNRNEPIEVDDFFEKVFNRSYEIYEASDGAFDISAAPLFDAWGFGFKHKEKITPQIIDSLKKIIGMDKIWLEGRRAVKTDPRVSLSMNAVAKGYASDVVAMWLEDRGIADYLVEIGGEIRCVGKNKQGKPWAVAIDRPEDGNMIPGENVQAVVQLTNRSMATSGNYRKYYVEDGRKYAHTINPKTCYPVTHSLLSATVFAADCMTADAYATVLMVLGVDEAKQLLNEHSELDAYLIYEEDGAMKSWCTPAVQKMLRE